jgi:multidrug efflux pump subunit AcrB
MNVPITLSLWMKTMNRCLPLPATFLLKKFVLTSASALVVAAVLALSASPATAQTMLREFPPTAQRGMLEITSPPDILINGTVERLSPGARIKGTHNMMVMSASLVGQILLVNYVRDPQGLVHEVWILNPDEAQQTPSIVAQ